MFLRYALVVVSVLNFLQNFHVSCGEFPTFQKPVFTPSRLVVKYGDPASAACLVCQHNCTSDEFGVEHAVGSTVKNGTTISWKVDNLTEWDISPQCYYTDDDGYQCITRLPITVYHPPINVDLSFKNHSGPMFAGHQYTLQCTVHEVAPIGNLSVIFYRGQTELQRLQPNSTTKEPVTETFTLNINPSKEDDGDLYWCEAKLDLGAEGPQPPSVVTSQKITTTVYYKPQLKESPSPEPITVTEGGPLQLNCSSEGNPSPSYTWTLPSTSHPPISDSTLSFEAVTRADGGQYICLVRNSVGNVTKEFTVDVKESNIYIIIIVVVAVIVLAVLVSAVVWHLYKNNRVGKYNLKDVFSLSQRHQHVAVPVGECVVERLNIMSIQDEQNQHSSDSELPLPKPESPKERRREGERNTWKMSTGAGIDYSVWDHIYVSDDEDVTSPFVDTPSLFRMRHRSRLERMIDFQQRGEELEDHFAECKRFLEEAQGRLRELEEGRKEGEEDEEKEAELEKIQAEVRKLKKDKKSFEKMIEEYRREEKNLPWNVDTISKEGFSKSVLNVKPVTKEDTREEKKHGLMEQVAHQAIVMQSILDLARTLKVDPRGCFRQFFSKIKTADKSYQDAFDRELELLKERIRTCAQLRMENAMKELEEEEKQKRLGPGGLDPVEVYESLPKEMQRSFDEKNIQMLHDIINKMDIEEGKYHLKRCIDSGLWVPDSGEVVALVSAMFILLAGSPFAHRKIMFLRYVFVIISVLNSLHDFHVCCDESCTVRPVFTPSRLVVKYGDPASATCLVFHNWTNNPLGVEHAVGYTAANGTTISWKVDNLTEWETSPMCYYTDDDNNQCTTSLPITVYQPPKNVDLSFLNPSGPMFAGRQYTLQCTVHEVAPISNLIVTFYRGQTELQRLQSSSTTKEPVTETFTLDINLSKDDGDPYWCEAKLDLGAEGPQPPPVVTSQKITTNDHSTPLTQPPAENYIHIIIVVVAVIIVAVLVFAVVYYQYTNYRMGQFNLPDVAVPVGE
ncbi:uncharacterized protein LOC128365260 [Scomber japonicus]|uniref:uncharacterized protein LOC128365260 n=1 Tax=Scomber japonicus TaxID=13676 RepID=UPI002306D5D8|nr:uncharacterized protein LOC128365260 [Scomber japonicus]